MFQSINPANGELFAEYEADTLNAVDLQLGRMTSAQKHWRSLGFTARGEVFSRFAVLLRTHTDALAKLAAREMGKPVTQGRGEVEKCAALADWVAENAEAALAPEAHSAGADDVYLQYEPLGIIFSVTPWNFPLWQVLRAALPIMAGGNGVLNKPSPNVIGCARELVRLFREAGAPDGVLETVNLSNEDAAQVISDARIAGVALTGSERAGASVAATAGMSIKPSLLELGGSDPFIVLADADLAAAAKAAARSRFFNAGQVCIASKRILVDEAVSDAFMLAFLRETQSWTPGDPMLDATMMGPMARADLRDQLSGQVRKSREEGARAVLAGGEMDGAGWFFGPTVLQGGPNEGSAMREELFGPAVIVQTFSSPREAIDLANATPFGLSANLWTADIDHALALAPQIESGGVFINATTQSDPRFPFGGIKRSGYGRELGEAGLKAFMNLKTVWVGQG